jgi:hypothetical protein
MTKHEFNWNEWYYSTFDQKCSNCTKMKKQVFWKREGQQHGYCADCTLEILIKYKESEKTKKICRSKDMVSGHVCELEIDHMKKYETQHSKAIMTPEGKMYYHWKTPYPECEFCTNNNKGKRVFGTKKGLNIHMAKKHKNIRRTCEFCKKGVYPTKRIDTGPWFCNEECSDKYVDY